MPKVSIIVTCKETYDISPLIEALSRQTYKDFELIITHNRNIPEGWNAGIEQANGEIIVLTEADCVPTPTWLEELVAQVKKGYVIVGTEIIPSPLCPSNVAIHRETLGKHRFDKSFFPADDTEFFIKLKANNIQIKKINGAFTYHNRQVYVKRTLLWSFLYGKAWAKIYHRYTCYEPIQKLVGRPILQVVSGLLNLLGFCYGFFRHLPERRFRKNPRAS